MARRRAAPQRTPLRETTNTARRTRAPPRPRDDSDDTRLVKTRRTHATAVAKAAQDEDKFLMAGGLGPRPSPPPPSSPQSASAGPRTVARRKATPSTATANSTAKTTAKTMKPVASIERTGLSLSLSSSPPPSDRHNSIRSRRPSQGTPAAESSVLALKGFRRRPRQPSILHMVQQHTASARPSAVYAAADDDDSTMLGSLDDEDVFAPEAEGTPVRIRQKGSVGVAALAEEHVSMPPASPDPQAAAPSSKRKPNPADVPSSSQQALKSKRQKLDLALPPTNDESRTASQHDMSIRNPSSGRRTTPLRPPASEIQVINSSPLSLCSPLSSPASVPTAPADADFTIPSTDKEHPPTPHELDEAYNVPSGTLAEPASSSPEPLSPPHTSHSRQRRTRSATPAEPLTQSSPSPPRRRQPAKQKQLRPMSTAALESLLPKWRRPLQPPPRGLVYEVTSASEDEDEDEELDASQLDEDEDELGGRLRRRTKNTTAAAKGRQGQAPTQAKSRGAKASGPRSRKKPASAPRGRKPTRKYGRAHATTSDKENDGDDGDSDGADLPEVTMYKAAQSAELEEAKRKFAEVDQWEMEFESLDAEEHRSSSQGWR